MDEEIYRLTPVFVIATVDKFARLAREGEAAALFGYVGRRCGRHGYVHPDYAGCNISTAHPAVNGYPAATVHPVGRLRPPGSDHPGRAASDHRGAGHRGRPVRGRGGDPRLLGDGRTASRCGR